MNAADLVAILGGVAAVLAVWKGLLEAARWFRRRRTRSDLKREFVELRGLDSELCEVAVELDYRLADGLGWAGYEIWPESFAPLMDRLRKLTFELDRMRARVRAQWAEGSVERLRDDVEQLVSVLRRATDLYTQGAIDRYRESEGEPVRWSASGRAPTHTLRNDEARNEVEELRQTARLLFRSSAHQLGLREAAERGDAALWPLLERDSLSLREHPAR